MKQNLEDTDVCITFDDNLKCQYEIALPVLDKYSLKAFLVHLHFSFRWGL